MKKDSKVSRRGLLGAGLSAGATAALGGPKVANAAPSAARASGYDAVRMAMHIHSCFSEGGSDVSGGGGASMMAQLEAARSSGVDVVWWTDHDWRMQAYGYYDGIAFDGTAEDGGLEWIVQNEGTVTGATYAFVSEPRSPYEPGRALRVTAGGTGPGWSGSYLFGKGGNGFYSTNISDTTITVDVLAEAVGTDAALVVQMETSYRPATGGRPAGVYTLDYRVGSEPGRRLNGPLVGVVEVAPEDGWQTLTLRMIDDVRAFWPDLVAEDSGLARLRFGVHARNGAVGSGVFDHLVFSRTRDQLEWPVRTQRDLMRRLAPAYPEITQVLGAELSMIRHLNVFMENFELYTYPPTGKAPVRDNSVAEAKNAIRWYHDRGALVQYNHPPTKPHELVRTRALGADLMEVANAKGNLVITRNRMGLFDVAARNAIFLTATSQIDDHEGRNWAQTPHLFLTSVWAKSTGTRDLLAALAAGRAWCHQQARWPGGRLDLRAGGRSVMGQVLRTRARRVKVNVRAEALPPGSTVRIVLGACDRTGATVPLIKTVTMPAAAFANGPVRINVARRQGRYLRVEVHDTDRVLLGYGNPFWVLSRRARVAVPRARRLQDKA
jgi:hypothetical protein